MYTSSEMKSNPWLIDRSGNSKEALRTTQLTAGTVVDRQPAVSPDGRRVAFMRTLSGGTSNLFVQALDGGEPQ